MEKKTVTKKEKGKNFNHNSQLKPTTYNHITDVYVTMYNHNHNVHVVVIFVL